MITSFLISIEILLQNIWKEKYFQNQEHDKNFQEDDCPQRPSPGHTPKTIVVEQKNTFYHKLNRISAVMPTKIGRPLNSIIINSTNMCYFYCF